MYNNEDNEKEKLIEKKQIPLRLSKSLYNDIAKWAEDDFRSLNGQIEYILTEAVRAKFNKKTHQNNNN